MRDLALFAGKGQQWGDPNHSGHQVQACEGGAAADRCSDVAQSASRKDQEFAIAIQHGDATIQQTPVSKQASIPPSQQLSK